ERAFPDEVIYAVRSHNDLTGVPRIHLMDKALFAVDELSGLITATALVRPTKSVFDVNAAAVRRKMKDKAFARNVSRDDILKGAADLGVDLDEHIAFVVRAMQEGAEGLGLRGAWTG
ncbi:MAG: HAD family hydrolase, partial [Chloroflexi bacterium]|nr:HAD family hydrolase [Chloroflexota bacterium]